MTIEIKTDANGNEVIILTEPHRGLHTDHIYVRACDGAVFTAPPGLLSRLGAPEVEMVKYYLDQNDGPCPPNVFEGDTAPDG